MSNRIEETDPDKLKAVKSWPEPVKIKTLRSFIGFTGYYRRFDKNYARIVKPLNDLLIRNPTHSTGNTESKKKKKKKKKK